MSGFDGAHPHDTDEHGLRPDGKVLVIDGKKGEYTREWGAPNVETHEKGDPESERRA